jgi:hypothetical protein
MKNYFKPLFWMALLSNFVMPIKAQIENQHLPMNNQIIIPYYDSLMPALKKLGLKLTDEIGNPNQCYKAGDAKIKTPIKGINPFEMPDSLKIYYSRPGALLEHEPEGNKDINIIWVHGLNGSTNSLRAAAIATEIGVPQIGFPARRVKSTFGPRTSLSHKTQFYGEDQGIKAAANDLNAYFRNPFYLATVTKKDYIIAHSQGGIVSREWMREMEQNPTLYKTYAHGLVTLGTPNHGAQILNNVLPHLGNRVPAFMNEACQSIGKSIITPMLNGNFITRIAISKNFEDKIVSATCNKISKTVVPLALDNYYKSTTLDYYVGAPFLKGYNSPAGPVQGLSDHTLMAPVVQFFGVEEQPVLWKFLSSTMGMGHDLMDENERYFFYDKDDVVEKEVAKNIGDLEAKILIEEERIKYHQGRLKQGLIPGAGIFIAINAMNMIKTAQENKAAYSGAKAWFSKANEMYLADLVGAVKVDMVKHCTVIDQLQCRDNGYNPVSSGLPPVYLEVKIKSEFPALNGNCGYSNGNVSQLYQNYSFVDEDHRQRKGNCEAQRVVIESYKTTRIELPNDGVVLAESASTPIKVFNSRSQFSVIMPNTNHEQMKNSRETRIALTNLYEGIYGRFFKVSRR